MYEYSIHRSRKQAIRVRNRLRKIPNCIPVIQPVGEKFSVCEAPRRVVWNYGDKSWDKCHWALVAVLWRNAWMEEHLRLAVSDNPYELLRRIANEKTT